MKRKYKWNKHIKAVIKKWNGKVKGGDTMENVIVFDRYLNKETLSHNSSEDNVCEWDVIGNIFSKAIKKQDLSKSQVDSMIAKVKSEVRDKKL